ncbi:hypothetical protein [Amycolatopsis sp. YIM 10]|uniref:hypothetical protein n=1 Tax=Amycolatopsis sp. YIM 10 TaxID=2653857 RepID=UPI0012905D4D|nr:hypothetical protein [Amycolatopsis sp. YIM 10]QFU89511.1 hypothetical protein YIM_21665 [Amycolatopsis sp. YIM 10]
MSTTRDDEIHPIELSELLHVLDPRLRPVALRLAREIDEPGLDATQLRNLQTLLKHLDHNISTRLAALPEQE